MGCIAQFREGIRNFTMRFSSTCSRTRQAWRAIRATGMPLAAIAAECGFSDQAHMTRSVKTVSGRCPSAWRSVGK